MKGFATNDQADYFSGITSITVNGKNAYKLKRKLLDDLRKYAFSGSDGIEPTNEMTLNLEETNQDDEQEIGETFRIETNLFDYETSLCEKFKVFNYLWMSLLMILWDSRLMTNTRMIGFMNRTKTCHGYTKNHRLTLEYGLNPLRLCCSKPFNYKNRCSEWPTYSWRGGNLPGSYIVGNMTCYQDLEWYDAFKDRELKEEALRNKAIMKGLINKDIESNNEDDEMYELCGNETHELPVCIVRRFEMIKYAFGQDKDYVAVREDEYEDLTSIQRCMMWNFAKPQKLYNPPRSEPNRCSVSNYVLEIFKKYEMQSCDPIGTPMEINDKLDLDQNGTPVDAKPIEKHLKEIKRIFRYLRGTVNTGLQYTKDSGFELTGFSDADYAGCKDTFKSTSVGAQFLGEKLVSWSSKRQDCMPLSTAKA
nr:uncharacterized mitochondrial protein AtMg00810-like [Tanacetum cinerariifolium]